MLVFLDRVHEPSWWLLHHGIPPPASVRTRSGDSRIWMGSKWEVVDAAVVVVVLLVVVVVGGAVQ